MSFQPTRHTLVRRVIERDPAAIRQFFENYRAPLLAYARSHVRPGRITEEDAEDCISEFFAEFTGGKLSSYQSAGGSFRSYLLKALSHRISTFVRDAQAKKRGGGAEIIPLEESPDAPPSAESAYAFERAWAETTMILAFKRLEAEQNTDDRKNRFTVLKEAVFSEPSADDVKRFTAALEVDSDAIRKAIVALRRALGRCVQAQIRDTLQHPTEAAVNAEFSALHSILRSTPEK